MTYIASRPGGRWEIRETHRTAAGPRSRTLASFRELTPEVVDRAVARSSGSLTARRLEEMATEAGARVGAAEVDRQARSLLARAAAGEMPHPGLARAVVDALASNRTESRDGDGRGGGAETRGDQAVGERLEQVIELAEALPYTPRTDPAYPAIAELVGETARQAAA